MFTGITWKCHVCGRERADQFISVRKVDLSSEFGFDQGVFTQNVRYCNDDPQCQAKAPEVRF